METFEMPAIGRKEFISYWNSLDKSKMDIKKETIDDCEEVKIFSKKTGKCLCAQRMWPQHQEKPVEYYILDDPDEDETSDVVYKTITLTSPQQVQAVYDALRAQGVI